MLAFQTVEYYNKTLDLLRKLESTFSFIEESIPYNQKKYILEKILNSRKANDGNDYIYRVEIKKCDEGGLLDYYQNCFTNFNNDFKFFEFYKLVTEVELEYNKKENWLKRSSKVIYTGKILHLDGDRRYSEKSNMFYRKMGLKAIVRNVSENRQEGVV